VKDLVLIIGTFVMLYMIVFPPFKLRRRRTSCGYSFIGTPPKRFGRRCVINVSALLNQLAACGVVFGLLEVFCS